MKRTLLGVTLLGLGMILGAAALADEDYAGKFKSSADADGVTQVWEISGDPMFWKIKIEYFDKQGKSIGSGHAATATRKPRPDELIFTMIWDQKFANWPDYPHCVMTLDKDNKDKGKFTFDFRKKELCTGELTRVTGK